MSFQIVTPSNPIRQRDDEGARRALKKAREQLDRTAEQERYPWLKVRQLALKLFGKEKGLNVSECKKLMEEIRKKEKV